MHNADWVRCGVGVSRSTAIEVFTVGIVSALLTPSHLNSALTSACQRVEFHGRVRIEDV